MRGCKPKNVAKLDLVTVATTQPGQQLSRPNKPGIGARGALEPGRFRDIPVGQRQSAFKCRRTNLGCRAILNDDEHAGNAGGMFRSFRTKIRMPPKSWPGPDWHST